jgi:hypothetical protein
MTGGTTPVLVGLNDNLVLELEYVTILLPCFLIDLISTHPEAFVTSWGSFGNYILLSSSITISLPAHVKRDRMENRLHFMFIFPS